MTAKQNSFYWRLWGNACQANHWSSQDGALRHDAHARALGYDKSHTAFTNEEFDRIIRFFQLLQDPDNLNAVLFFQNPGREEKKRLIWSIQHLADEPYIKAIAADRFGTIYWQDLDVPQLTWLRNTVHNRMRVKRRREATGAAAPAPAPEGELVGAASNCPF